MSLNTKPFIQAFNGIARQKHRYTVFSDFVRLSAISLHNSVNKIESLEDEYMEIIKGYSKDEANSMAQLLGEVVQLLDGEPIDVLGALYMDLDFGNAHTGQFFTPNHISQLMAQMSYDDQLRNLEKPFITLSEPACGAGGMVLAFVKVMLSYGHNPAERLWVQCIDIDRIAALMCYVQLTLWNVPAQIIVGNTLTMEFNERYYTPAHYLNGWDIRLKWNKLMDYALERDTVIENTSPPVPKLSSEGTAQLELF